MAQCIMHQSVTGWDGTSVMDEGWVFTNKTGYAELRSREQQSTASHCILCCVRAVLPRALNSAFVAQCMTGCGGTSVMDEGLVGCNVAV